MNVAFAAIASLAVAALLLGSGPAVAATRSVTVTLKASEAVGSPDAGEVQLYGSSHALVIGIDRYEDRAWPRLSHAVSDARSVAKELEAHGFDVSVATDLDGARLSQTLKNFFIRKGQDPQARLFVWFAGHGHTLSGEGFLIPADGASPSDEVAFLEKAISLRNFGTYVRYAKSKHVLAVFDSCFAGTIFNVARSRTPPAITRVTTEPVRQFLSSGDAGQEVSDDGRFARIFVEALEGRRRADANGDGYLTGTEIGEHLTYEIANLSRNAQTPKYGKLLSDQFNKGDFVFVLPGASASRPSSSAQRGGADATVWDRIQNSSNPIDFRTFLKTFPNSPFAPFAQARLQSVSSTQTASLTPSAPPADPTPSDIREAQQMLSDLGYSPGPPDGIMGSRTRESLMRFQSQEALPVNGEVSDGVLAQLRKARTQTAAIRPAPVTTPGVQTTPAVGVFFRPGTTFRDCAECPEMVVIPQGSFEMGSTDGRDNEKPVRRVDIRYPFAVGKYEITQSEWRAVMGNNPSKVKGDRNPVEDVRWNKAKEFTKKLSAKTGQTYRLLSEAEWEYVARAGTQTKFWCGDSEICLSAAAVYSANSGRRTAPVGSKSANAFGLYDMHGNVWEWVEDCLSDNYKGAHSDGSANIIGKSSRRVVRGGSAVDAPEQLRSAYRSTSGDGYHLLFLGFRIARLLPNT